MIPPIELVSKQLILLITQDKLMDLVIILNKRMNNSRINEIIETVGLEKFYNAYPSQLSGGMKP